MASLSKITEGGRSSWVVRFYLDKRRYKIGLGVFDESDAEIAKNRIEHLVEMKRRGRSPDRVTLRWLDQIPTELHERLAKVGLVDPRSIQDHPTTVLAFMRAHIASRSDWKKPENYSQAVSHLESYLGKDVPLRAITRAEVDRWHRWMTSDPQGPRLSANTAGQNVKRCRQMMRVALDDRLIEVNPFSGVKIDLRSDPSKNRFISGETTKALFEACPDAEWRCIVALARYGGLRCPSEVLALRWTDIVWDRDRFKVTSPKTARYGKADRIVPLFPELRAELDELFSQHAPGADCPADSYVIQRYRCSEANLRSSLYRIADRAGVDRWPKPFMSFRSSRRTELENAGYKNHVLNDWFGHSGAVAETHYLQTTEADFQAAVGLSVGPSVGPSQGNQSPPQPIKKRKNPGKTGVLMATNGLGYRHEHTQEDSRSVGDSKANHAKAAAVGLPVGPSPTLTPELAELLGLWAALDDVAKRDLLAVAKAWAASGEE